MAGRREPPPRIRGRHCGGRRTSNPQRPDSCQRNAGRWRHRYPETGVAAAGRNDADQRRQFTFRKGERTLMTGPSGSGKSTLFRAIAGIWPFGAGSITVPAGATLMMLPQRPYFPVGSLQGGDRISGEGRRVHRRADRRDVAGGGTAGAGGAARRARPLEQNAVARRTATARDRPRALACAAIPVPRRSHRLARRAIREGDVPPARGDCRRPPSSRSAIARRWTPSISASRRWRADGDRFVLQDRSQAGGHNAAPVAGE